MSFNSSMSDTEQGYQSQSQGHTSCIYGERHKPTGGNKPTDLVLEPVKQLDLKIDLCVWSLTNCIQSIRFIFH